MFFLQTSGAMALLGRLQQYPRRCPPRAQALQLRSQALRQGAVAEARQGCKGSMAAGGTQRAGLLNGLCKGSDFVWGSDYSNYCFYMIG